MLSEFLRIQLRSAAYTIQTCRLLLPTATLERMPNASPEIVLCPPKLTAEALALVLGDIAPSQRREIASPLVEVAKTGAVASETLVVAMQGDELRGAAWGQQQPGHTAVLWVPQLVGREPKTTAVALAKAAVETLDAAGVEMTQALLPAADSDAAPTLQAAQFRHLADLLYLSCEAERFATAAPNSSDLEFVPYDDSLRVRLMRVIERTYEGTLDCPDLNGVRSIENVVHGYQCTGIFHPENWLIAQNEGQDVGVLLLAEHPAARHWELMYMGLIPEARGRGWGRQVTRYAQSRARDAGVERIVLAVDAVNQPALKMYNITGFVPWDRRAVYIRLHPHLQKEQQK